MAFNFTALLGGMASGLSERIDIEEAKLEKAADRAYTRSEQERLARRAKREKEKLIAEETMGMLTSLGYSEDNAAAILKKGNVASQWWITQGTEALKKGMDPNTLANFPGMSGTFNEADKNTVTETVNAVPTAATAATPEGLGSITEAAESGTVDIADGFTLNLDAMRRLYGVPEKTESSFSARLAVISQNLARKPNDPKVDQWKAEQAQLLSDLRTMKEQERDNTGKTGPSFDAGSITSHVNEIRRGALNRYGFEVGIDGGIKNMEEGNRHYADIAELNVASQLNQRNTGIDDPVMNHTADGIRNAAIANLTDYGYSVKNKGGAGTPIDNASFVEGVKSGKFRSGQVVTVGTKVIVYTGVADYKTGNPFIILNPE